MCKDLETQAQDYAEWQTCDLESDFITVGMVRQMIVESYKQGYKDAATPHRSMNIDASPVMIEIAIENLHKRGKIELHEDLSYNEKLSNMKKIDAEIKRLNKQKKEQV